MQAVHPSLILRAALVAAIGSACFVPRAALAQSTAPDSAAFVTRLGTDTLALERFVREGNRVTAEVVLRVPTTVRTSYTMELAPSGELQRLEGVSRNPAGSVVRREVIERSGDSLHVSIAAGERSQQRTVPAGSATLPFIDMVHWPFELVLMRAARAGSATLTQPLLTGARTSDFTIGRSGADSMTITHPFRGTMRARVDAEGRLLGLDAAETTRKVVVERQRWVELDDAVRAWGALDAAGRGVGALSGRGEAQGMVGGASIGIDYGTPVKRGREIWGALVPYGELWRTGANLATHLTTDRDLVLGSGADTLRVPAGQYTLFSIPERDGGVLIVSRQTGQNGNAYDAAHDLGRVRMTSRAVPEVVEVFTIAVTSVTEQGAAAREARGELRLQWDRTEFVTPIRVP